MGMLLHRHNLEVQAVEKPSVPTKEVSKKDITKKDLFGVSKDKLIAIAKDNGVEFDEKDKAGQIKEKIIAKLGL